MGVEEKANALVEAAKRQHEFSGEAMLLFYDRDALYWGSYSTEPRPDKTYGIGPLPRTFTPDFAVQRSIEQCKRRGEPVPFYICDFRAAAAIGCEYCLELPTARLLARGEDCIEVFAHAYLDSEDEMRLGRRVHSILNAASEHGTLPELSFVLQLDAATEAYYGALARHDPEEGICSIDSMWPFRRQAMDFAHIASSLQEQGGFPVLCERRDSKEILESVRPLRQGDYALVPCEHGVLEVYTV